MLAGLAVWRRTMNGSKVTAPLASWMAPAGKFEPHQLWVASLVLAAAPRLVRLLPLAAVLPASRLKCIARWLAPAPESDVKMPPPQLLTQFVPSAPVAVFPVIVTLERVVVSLLRLLHNPPPWFPWLPLIAMAVPVLSMSRPWPVEIPPPCPAAL